MVVAVFLPDAACKWWWWYLFSEQADWTLCFLFLYSIVTESQTRQAEWRMWKFSYFAITQSIKLNVDFPKHKTVDLDNKTRATSWFAWNGSLSTVPADTFTSMRSLWVMQQKKGKNTKLQNHVLISRNYVDFSGNDEQRMWHLERN